MATEPSRKFFQNKLGNEHSCPSLNSNSAVREENDCVKVINDLVFQKYGEQRDFYRKKLKKLRKTLHPDSTNDSDSDSDFGSNTEENPVCDNEDEHSSTIKNITVSNNILNSGLVRNETVVLPTEHNYPAFANNQVNNSYIINNDTSCISIRNDMVIPKRDSQSDSLELNKIDVDCDRSTITQITAKKDEPEDFLSSLNKILNSESAISEKDVHLFDDHLDHDNDFLKNMSNILNNDMTKSPIKNISKKIFCDDEDYEDFLDIRKPITCGLCRKSTATVSRTDTEQYADGDEDFLRGNKTINCALTRNSRITISKNGDKDIDDHIGYKDFLNDNKTINSTLRRNSKIMFPDKNISVLDDHVIDEGDFLKENGVQLLGYYYAENFVNEDKRISCRIDRNATITISRNDDPMSDYYEDIDDDLMNDSEEITKQRLNSTFSPSVGLSDVSDLVSVRSIDFCNNKSPEKSINDKNNNTVEEFHETDNDQIGGDNKDDYIEEVEDREEISVANEIGHEEIVRDAPENTEKCKRDDLQDCINVQQLAIQEFEKVLKFGKWKKGFAGSIPHIQVEKGLLLATLRKQVIKASLYNDDRRSPLTYKNPFRGKITVKNIQCDSTIIGNSHKLCPSYYLCVLQHGTSVLGTEILAPDIYGTVAFPNKFEFNDVSNDFTIKMMLFKLQLKKDNNTGWKVSLKKRQFELPKLVLIGDQEITVKNLNTTAFSFKNEILYANFTACLDMAIRKEGNLTVQRIVRKNKKETKLVSHKRWCVLEGTDLKVYRCSEDVEYTEPVEVISLVYCKACKPYLMSPRILALDFVYTYSSGLLYIPFDDRDNFKDWMNYINLAILTTQSFGL